VQSVLQVLGKTFSISHSDLRIRYRKVLFLRLCIGYSTAEHDILSRRASYFAPLHPICKRLSPAKSHSQRLALPTSSNKSRLLRRSDTVELSTTKDFIGNKAIPPYAIRFYVRSADIEKKNVTRAYRPCFEAVALPLRYQASDG
jgi:hypothetical protein